MPVKEVSNGQLKKELENAGDKLVFVDFYATWCGPCQRVAPTIEKLSGSHPNAVFLKVDVDKCETESQEYEISAMPTFVFFRQSKELERIQGADINAIESALKKHYKETSAFSGTGHSMLESNSTISNLVKPGEQSDYDRFEQAAKKHFADEKEGGTMTTLRLRLPDVAKPINIQLSTYHTLSEIRHLLCENIEAFQVTPFEFMVPPATKIKLEEEDQTIAEAKLANAALIVKKI